MSRIRILTIGDELLEGRLVDTHSAFLSERLFSMGMVVDQHTSIRDDLPTIVSSLQTEAGKADALLVCGGLGPTTDDLTAEAAALAAGVDLELNEGALEHVRSLFARMGRTMTRNNEKQAFFPQGATLMPNPLGTACGFHLALKQSRAFFMPGVPHEMKGMFEASVVPELLKRLERKVFQVAGLKTFGLGESKIGSLLQDLKAVAPGQLWIQYRAASPEVHVRLCLFGMESDPISEKEELERLRGEARVRLGRAVFTEDDRSLPETVLQSLEARGETLSVAESCTGGLLAAQLTDVPGASKTFVGGVVAYANTVKTALLGVPEALLMSHGAVSAEVAEAMAAGARAALGSTYALSITGVAGPSGGTPEKPVGTVFLGLATPSMVYSRKVFYLGQRDRIRRFSAYGALEILRRSLMELPLSDS